MRPEEKIERLIDRGVIVHSPFSVEIDDDVDPERISSNGVILHSGTRLRGKDTFIANGAVIGREGPVTVENCWIGPDVELKGGYFKKAVFLEKSSAGNGAHVREGTILEEEAGIAHTVGLKQTILFPFVTLGSLINFCDCLMAGGTSRKNHSEVGSSYIHFNFTPNQDKATASLIGDVPFGVMLNKEPIFLGGQGGLVGPCILNYGTVVAAGTIQRQDEIREGRLLFGGGLKRGSIKAPSGVYTNVKRIIDRNINYIANLIALHHWYRHIRVRFISDRFPGEVYKGLCITLDSAIDERVKRLNDLTGKFKLSLEELARTGEGHKNLVSQKNQFIDQWPNIEKKILMVRNAETDLFSEKRSVFLKNLEKEISLKGNQDYTGLIQVLPEEIKRAGTDWLKTIADHVTAEIMTLLPDYK